MAAIRFERVWKRYGSITAVANLDLVCHSGEMLALLGPSGCGKSSTLKMAAGIEEVSEGEIYFDSRPVSQIAPGARNIAMVFEDYALYPHLTVRQNIAFPLSVRNVPAAEAEAKVEEIIALLQLGPIADRGVKALSGGAQQRTSIGRALVRQPELILFDEPLSHLDAEQKIHLRSEIKRLQTISSVTSILVTHDQTEATAMADRIAVMQNGVLQQVSPPDELYTAPANVFVAGFIGEPPMNLLTASIANGRLNLADADWDCPLGSRVVPGVQAGHPFLAGIRPEHVCVRRNGEGAVAVVGYCEPRGDTDVVLITSSARPSAALVAEIPGPSGLLGNEVVRVSFAPDRVVHLFSCDDGKRIGSL